MTVRSGQDALVREYLRRLGWGLREMALEGREQLMAEITDHIARARAELDPRDDDGVRRVLDRLGPPEAIVASAAEQEGLRAPAWRARGDADDGEAAADEEAALRALIEEAVGGPVDPAPEGAATPGASGGAAEPGSAAAPSGTAGAAGAAAGGPAAGPSPGGARGGTAAAPAGTTKAGPGRKRPTEADKLAVRLLLVGGLLLVAGWVWGVVLLWRSRVFTVQDKVIGTAILPGGLLPAVYVLFRPIGGSGWLVRLAEFAILVLLPVATSNYLNRRLMATQVATGFERFRVRRAAHAAERERNEQGLR